MMDPNPLTYGHLWPPMGTLGSVGVHPSASVGPLGTSMSLSHCTATDALDMLNRHNLSWTCSITSAMSSYQVGRGGRGRSGGTHHGGQYDNQSRGDVANLNWRGLPLQPSGSRNLNPREQHHSRAPWGGYGDSSSTPRGSSSDNVVQYQCKDVNPRPPQQPVGAPRGIAPLAQHSVSTQQQQTNYSNLQQANQPRQLAPIRQATSLAVGGLSAQALAHKELEELMAELSLQQETPPPSGSTKAIKFLHRPGKGIRGQKVLVRANHFLVQLSGKELHHYDVMITPTLTSRGTNREVMKALVKAYQQSSLAGRLPVYDGRRSLYTAGPLPFESQRFAVILTDEDQPQRGRNFKVEIKHVGCADLRHLQMFLMGGQCDAPHNVIQTLDIVLGEHPSNRNSIVSVGRSFFSDHFSSYKLGDGLESWQGFYKSLRPTQMGLSLNFDISSTAFIDSIMVSEFVSKLIGKDLNYARLTHNDIAKIRINLKGVKVEVTHRGNLRRKYRISGLTAQATRDLLFKIDELGTKTKLIDYFRDVYSHNIRYLNIPCLEAGTNPKRPIYLPMEVCRIVKGQKYRKKLNENQTTNVLRAACQDPADREYHILNTIRDNRYGEDIFAMEFGLKVSDQPTTIQARLLPPPLLKYHDNGAEKECTPRFGAWNLRNKKLVNGGKVNFWYCISFSPKASANDARWFCKKLADMCLGLGLEFAENPILHPIVAQSDRLERVLKSRYQEAVNTLSHVDKLPDLLIAIIPDNNGNLYSDLKRICETDIGLVTQCCLAKNVARPNSQYLANVALKINVKMGGRNTVLADAVTRKVPIVSRTPTIIFGADVSHPSPGEDSNPSIAVVVASQDWPEITTYVGSFRTQKHRLEIIFHLGEMVKEHLISFRRKTNLEPKQIIFYRDGVSESQFQKVLQHEISAIRNACKQLHPDYVPTITFIVVQKRHHTRLFPVDRRNMDRSGNVLPGTVVDTKICHPTEFDFYLCSHAGIKGTSRPAHYHVLWDDNGFNADDLQGLTYNLCYTYVRCTRSVSIVPPAYYAHHIASRARSYMDPRVSDAGSSVSGSSTSRSEVSSATIKQLPALKENVKNVMFYC